MNPSARFLKSGQLISNGNMMGLGQTAHVLGLYSINVRGYVTCGMKGSEGKLLKVEEHGKSHEVRDRPNGPNHFTTGITMMIH